VILNVFEEYIYYTKSRLVSYLKKLYFSGSGNTILLLYSAGDAIVVKGLCDFLHQIGHLTIPVSESASEALSIDMSNEDQLLDTAHLMDITLVLYSDRASPVLQKAVQQIFAVDDLHVKTKYLIFNTYATELQIPNAVIRRFTDRIMMTTRVKDLLDGVGGMFMYKIVFDKSVLLFIFNSSWFILIQWMKVMTVKW